jgi:hypothetical protein
MQEFRVKTLGFDNLKEMYRDDPDFKEAYEASEFSWIEANGLSI